MAKRRMFSTEIVYTDAFLCMPPTAQLLYFHLGLQADDDGFAASPRMMARCIGADDGDLKLLSDKGYITLFDSGVCKIRDWETNNRLRRDCYRPTRYQQEKSSLAAEAKPVAETVSDPVPDVPEPIPDTGETIADAAQVSAHDAADTVRNVTHDVTDTVRDVTLDVTNTVRDVTLDVTDTVRNRNTGKVREGKVREGKAREVQDRKERENEGADGPPRTRAFPPTPEEVKAYCLERGSGIDPVRFVDYYTANGWKQGPGRPIRDWRAAVRTWERRDKNGPDHHGHGREDPAIPGVLCL